MPLKNSLKITFIEILNILILQINLIIYQKKKIEKYWQPFAKNNRNRFYL